MTSKRCIMKHVSTRQVSTALVAAALVLSAGTAGASILAVADDNHGVTPSINEGANNEAFLSVYDPNQGKTFVQDLGTTWSTLDGLKANSNPGLSYDLSSMDGGTNWTIFKNGITNPNAVNYAVIASDMGQNISVTGNQPFDQTGRSYANGDTVNNLSVTVGQRATNYDDPNQSPNYALNSSYVISNSNDPRFASHEPFPGVPAGGTSVGVWGGWSNPSLFSGNTAVAFNPNGVYGHVVGFQWGHDTGAANQFGTYAATWLLAGNTLTFGTPAPVPIPAAVYLFGSGLAGIAAFARRKPL
jgi:hypothetical protein